jgi:hypothetical protein
MKIFKERLFLFFLLLFNFQNVIGQTTPKTKQLQVHQLFKKIVLSEDTLFQFLNNTGQGVLFFCPRTDDDSIHYVNNIQTLMKDLYENQWDTFSISLVFYEQNAAKYPEVFNSKGDNYLIEDVEPILFCPNPMLLNRAKNSKFGEFIDIEQLSSTLYVLQMADGPPGTCSPKGSGKISFFHNFIRELYLPTYNQTEFQQLFFLENTLLRRQVKELQSQVDELRRSSATKNPENKFKSQ